MGEGMKTYDLTPEAKATRAVVRSCTRAIDLDWQIKQLCRITEHLIIAGDPRRFAYSDLIQKKRQELYSL